jgi:hypothetical protein
MGQVRAAYYSHSSNIRSAGLLFRTRHDPPAAWGMAWRVAWSAAEGQCGLEERAWNQLVADLMQPASAMHR